MNLLLIPNLLLLDINKAGGLAETSVSSPHSHRIPSQLGVAITVDALH